MSVAENMNEDKDKIISQELASELVTRIFDDWNRILESRGQVVNIQTTKRRYKFSLDRTSDQKSPFSADEVHVTELKDNIPLEKWLQLPENNPFKTQDGEKWLIISITPKDPFKSPIAVEKSRGQYDDPFETERLFGFISSKGRAYEQTSWCHVPTEPFISNKKLCYLKKPPEGPQIELASGSTGPTPINPMKGATFERIGFLLTSVQKNRVQEHVN